MASERSDVTLPRPISRVRGEMADSARYNDCRYVRSCRYVHTYYTSESLLEFVISSALHVSSAASPLFSSRVYPVPSSSLALSLSLSLFPGTLSVVSSAFSLVLSRNLGDFQFSRIFVRFERRRIKIVKLSESTGRETVQRSVHTRPRGARLSVHLSPLASLSSPFEL